MNRIAFILFLLRKLTSQKIVSKLAFKSNFIESQIKEFTQGLFILIQDLLHLRENEEHSSDLKYNYI